MNRKHSLCIAAKILGCYCSTTWPVLTSARARAHTHTHTHTPRVPMCVREGPRAMGEMQGKMQSLSKRLQAGLADEISRQCRPITQEWEAKEKKIKRCLCGCSSKKELVRWDQHECKKASRASCHLWTVHIPLYPSLPAPSSAAAALTCLYSLLGSLPSGSQAG